MLGEAVEELGQVPCGLIGEIWEFEDQAVARGHVVGGIKGPDGDPCSAHQRNQAHASLRCFLYGLLSGQRPVRPHSRCAAVRTEDDQ